MEFTTRLGLHSQATRLWGERPSRPATVTTGLAPSMDKRGPLQDGLGLAAVTNDRASKLKSPPERYISRPPAGAAGFSAGLFPFRSPLLGESSLVSFPPLTDMLKFGG
jgi:hypothetical protein